MSSITGDTASLNKREHSVLDWSTDGIDTV